MIKRKALALLLVTISPLALAHAHLKESSPARDATLTTAPKTLQVTFTEGVETALSTLTLTGDNGTRATLGKLQPVPHKQNTYRVALPALTSGSYHVKMEITSVDTHRLENDLDFSVR